MLRSDALGALRIPGYRWLLLNSLGLTSSWTLETLATGWLALELTNSPFWLGVVVGVRGLSQFVSSIVGGALADRFDLRRVLVTTHLISAAIALTLFALARSGTIQVGHLVAAGVVNGALGAINGPSQQALTFQIVGAKWILNARSFHFMAAGLMRILAAIAGGLLIQQLGVAIPYLLLSGSLVVAALALLPLHSVPRQARATERPLSALASGFRYALGARLVRELLLLSLVTEAFAFSYQAILPVIARDVLGVDAFGLGQLVAVGAAGQLAGTILLAALGDPGRKHVLLLGSSLGLGLAVLLLAVSPSFAVSLAVMVLIGVCSGGFDTLIETVLQLAVHGDMRGRVLGLFVATWGFSGVAGFALGALATAVGSPVALAVFATLAIANSLRLVGRVSTIDPARAGAEAGVATG